MDNVASQMGSLLLKGYRMLATSCEICNTVLMQDKQGRIFCILCEEKKKNEPVNEGEGDAQAGLVAKKKPNRLGENDPNGNLYRALSFSQSVLMDQMKFTADTLESGRETMDIHSKILHVKFIQQCAETISFIQKMDA